MSYWMAALLLVAFGFVTGFSIGPPFFLVGLALLVLGPLRRWPRLFWPPLVGVLAFTLGVVLFIPLSCTATAESARSRTPSARASSARRGRALASTTHRPRRSPSPSAPGSGPGSRPRS
jgi:hypothetical protein